MTVNVRKVDSGAIIDLNGPLKMGEAVQTFRDSIQEVLDSGTNNVAINLAELTEMDSSGMGALVRVYTTIKRGGGKCRFFAASKKTLQFLKMVRLDTVLELVDDEAAALKDF